MKILLTGVTGYVGRKLLPELVRQGNEVVCCVRDAKRFNPPENLVDSLKIIEVDFLDKKSLKKIPEDIDGAFYLIHSMASSSDFEKLELDSAKNFKEAMNHTNVKHVVYLSGIVNESALSKHLSSRKAVEIELAKGNYNFTTLRSGIIIGSGSASFEIIRDLVEKLPIMITPKWLSTKCQPIGIYDVISFLSKTLFNPATFNQNFDIGGPDIYTYKEILLAYAKVRGLKRTIIPIPFFAPKISSYWLYFITSTSFELASSLVNSMKVEVVCKNDHLNHILDIKPMGYEEALQRTLLIVEGQQVISNWKDSMISGGLNINLSDFLNVPTHGCYVYSNSNLVKNKQNTIDKIWSIGGKKGWYYANWLWKLRGFIDSLFGGVGLKRGRKQEFDLSAGEAVDFWRVIYENRNEGRLLLFGEMKIPGEAWIEFSLHDETISQVATFRPKGLLGRFYWMILYPFHQLIFNGMIRRIAS